MEIYPGNTVDVGSGNQFNFFRQFSSYGNTVKFQLHFLPPLDTISVTSLKELQWFLQRLYYGRTKSNVQGERDGSDIQFVGAILNVLKIHIKIV